MLEWIAVKKLLTHSLSHRPPPSYLLLSSPLSAFSLKFWTFDRQVFQLPKQTHGYASVGVPPPIQKFALLDRQLVLQLTTKGKK